MMELEFAGMRFTLPFAMPGATFSFFTETGRFDVVATCPTDEPGAASEWVPREAR